MEYFDGSSNLKIQVQDLGRFSIGVKLSLIREILDQYVFYSKNHIKYLSAVGKKGIIHKLIYESCENLYFTTNGLSENEIAFMFSDDTNTFSVQVLKHFRIAKIMVADESCMINKYFSLTSLCTSSIIPHGLAALLSIIITHFKIKELTDLYSSFKNYLKKFQVNDYELKIGVDEIFFARYNDSSDIVKTEQNFEIINPLITMFEGYLSPELHYCNEYTFINNHQVEDQDKVPNFDILSNAMRSLLIFTVNQSETVYYQTEQDGALKSVNIDCFYKLIEEGKIKQGLFDSSILINRLVEIKQSIATSIRFAINNTVKGLSESSNSYFFHGRSVPKINADVIHSDVESQVSTEFGDFWAYTNRSIKFISIRGEILRVSEDFKLPIEFIDFTGKKHFIQTQVLFKEKSEEISEHLNLAYGFYKSIFQKSKLKDEQRSLTQLNKMVNLQLEKNQHMSMLSYCLAKSSDKPVVEVTSQDKSVHSQIQLLLSKNEDFSRKIKTNTLQDSTFK